ncbi:hypothetical protein RXV95_13020 [Novosphingobium sp. ZN18A2]|uniref:tetratricopeptide repeat protein n=1 Tax=Novosphingobium sp. ZN18A2 TaxID=3079861 RepID=UPI0030CE70BB
MKPMTWATVFGIGIAALQPSTAHADWLEVSSPNFRFYSQGKEQESVETVQNLEKLDHLVRAVTGNDKPPSPKPLTIYELGTMQDVQATMPGGGRGVAGYYTTSPQGAHLITFRKPVEAPVPGSRLKRIYNINAEVTQHEYLHHLMFQYFPTNYPTFYPEGFAEYYGTMLFEPNNVIVVGHAPVGRLESLKDWLPIRKVLTAKSYGDVTNLSSLYAEGWLLTHMAAARPEVGKEMASFLRAITKGVPYEKAAEDSFGDLDAFDKKVHDYAGHVTALTIKLKPFAISKVTVRHLSPVEEKLISTEIKLRSGMKVNEADAEARRVRSVVEANPGNAYALGVLALTECVAGEMDQARATAQRLLSIDPGNVRGDLALGMVQVAELAGSGSDDATAWDEAREPLARAINSDATATWPRIAYYQSYLKEGVLPSAGAQNALVQAFKLIPQDDDVRYLVARDYEMRGMIKAAIFTISPSAYGTFDGNERRKRKRDKAYREAAAKYTNIAYHESAGDMLKRLEAKRDGRWDEKTGTITAAPKTASAPAS